MAPPTRTWKTPPRLQPGEGWQVRCPSCTSRGATLPQGKCRSCSAVVFDAGCPIDPDVHSLAPLDPLIRRARFYLLLFVPVLAPFFIGLAIAWAWFNYGITWLNDAREVVAAPPGSFLWPNHILPAAIMGTMGILAVGFPVLPTSFRRSYSWGLRDWQRAFPPAGTAPGRGERLTISTFQVSTDSHRPPTKIQINAMVQIRGVDRDKPELTIRVRGPDGNYVPSRTEEFRGKKGEFLLQVRGSSVYGGDLSEQEIVAEVRLDDLGSPVTGEENTLIIEALLGLNTVAFDQAEGSIRVRL